jgi:hypothetical protein
MGAKPLPIPRVLIIDEGGRVMGGLLPPLSPTAASAVACAAPPVRCTLQRPGKPSLALCAPRTRRGGWCASGSWSGLNRTGIRCARGGTAATVLIWRKRAASPAEAINRHRLRALPVPQGPRAERGHGSGCQPACETGPAGENVPDAADGRPGGWRSGALEFCVLIAAVVGPRPHDTAQAVVAATTARGAGRPACGSDGVTGSLAALIAPVLTTLVRTGNRGCPRPPRCVPPLELVYGPWGKQQQPGPFRTLSRRVGLGAARLAPLGGPISSAVGERGNETWWQAWAPLARQTSRRCKDRERLRQRVIFCPAVYQAARPHRRWRGTSTRITARCVRGGASVRPQWRQA